MEVDRKQQKMDNQETIQALLLVYNQPSLIRNQEGSVSTVGCMPQFRVFFLFQLLSKCT